MAKRIVECVPNISEGRNTKVIDAVVNAASSISGASVLDVDPGAATNRTVITIAGEPEAVLESAFNVIKSAGELIDMSVQHGAHPRHGATDVCPFVPVSGITMEECAELARRLGKRVGEELGIPVYLYEYAASKPEWKKLPNIREGEYEALPDKLGKPEWEPDFGPGQWNERVKKTGVCTIGARNFLIAYNVNLNTRDTGMAKEIALNIRDTGRTLRTPEWKFARDEQGNKIKQEGRLKNCKATGWFIEEYDRAQVTMNLTDISVTPLHMGYEVTKEEAEKLGLAVTGSEVVGLLPLSAMLDAGRYYLERQNRALLNTGKQAKTTGAPERELVNLAIRSMGLSDVAEFDPDKKIIEYMIADKSVNLSGMTCRDFCDELSIDSPAPGGGSAAALMGAVGAGLNSMVANLTVKNRKFRSSWNEMLELAPAAQEIKEFLINAIDEDTRAFNMWMDTARSGGDVQDAIKNAVEVPLSVLEKSPAIAEMGLALVERGMQSSLSDAGVAAAAARACATGAYYNVLINLPEIEDEGYRNETMKKAAELLAKTESIADNVKARVISKLENGE
ncbi:glutamate formimidoyltransferase [Candidatus Fermentibacteria bacterium]|nr:MAG: glutamate formimidoyltransferase [Candidatus Fermentibacteria bacterium]